MMFQPIVIDQATAAYLAGKVKPLLPRKTLEQVKQSQHFQEQFRHFNEDLLKRDVFQAQVRPNGPGRVDRDAADLLKRENEAILESIEAAGSKKQARQLKKMFYANNKHIHAHDVSFNQLKARSRKS